jgi:hypothetical protein
MKWLKQWLIDAFDPPVLGHKWGPIEFHMSERAFMVICEDPLPASDYGVRITASNQFAIQVKATEGRTLVYLHVKGDKLASEIESK